MSATHTSRRHARDPRRPSLLARLARDESGGEILEYVLIAGLIIAATVAVIAGFGGKVMARWTTVSGSSL